MLFRPKQKLMTLSLSLLLCACGSGSSSKRSGSAAVTSVTVSVTNAGNGAPISGATVELTQSSTLSLTTNSAGQATFDSSNGFQIGSYSLLVRDPNFQPVFISELGQAAPNIRLQAVTAPSATALTITSTGLPAPLPAMSPGAPAVASVDVSTTSSTNQAGIDSGVQMNGDSELTTIGQPGVPLTVMNIRGHSEVFSATVVDLSVPGPGGMGHPIYFALAAFPNGVLAGNNSITLNFQDVSASASSVQGSITCTNDFDLSTDTISLRPVAFANGVGSILIGGIHQNNAITGSGQMASFGFSGPTLNFMFLYDSALRDQYAYECTVSKANARVAQYLRGAFASLPTFAMFNLRAAISAVNVDTSGTPTRPLVSWTHSDSPGAYGGFYRVTLSNGNAVITLYGPGDATELRVPASLALQSGLTYAVEVSAVFVSNPDLSQVSKLTIAESASDVASRSTNVTIP